MDPIVEKIAQNIEAAINLVTVANGFNQILTAVRSRRVDFSDVTPSDGIVLLVMGGEEQPEGVIGCQEWIQGFELVCFVLDSDRSTDAIDIRKNKVRADLQKKLKADPSRGGLAIDTELAPSSQFEDGIAVGIKVYYRVDMYDPYELA